MTWDELITDYLTFLVAAGRPASTINLRADQLRHAARGLPAPAQVGAADLLGWCAAQCWAPETRRSYRAALRGVFAFGHAAGRLPGDPAAGLPAVSVPAGVPRPTPERVYRTALLAAPPRVALMLRCAAEAGLRRAEIARLHTADVLAAAEGPVLLVHGKGGKTRLVPLSGSLAAAIRASGSGWVFGNRAGDGPLSPEWVGELCAAVLPGGFTLHSLRHRFATKAYAGSRDLRAVQILLGHTSPTTTQRYVAVCDSDLRRAAMLAAQ